MHGSSTADMLCGMHTMQKLIMENTGHKRKRQPNGRDNRDQPERLINACYYGEEDFMRIFSPLYISGVNTGRVLGSQYPP